MGIGRLFGVRIRLHPLFLALLALLGAGGLLEETLILFGVVFLHELAHVVVALACGLKVREVELLPFGGVARVDDLVELEPAVEAAVAVAGPLTNAFLYVIALAVAPHAPFAKEHVELFLQANLGIGLFNLLPALPLDGGRILRAALVQRIGFRRATDLAVGLGKLWAVLLGAVGAYLLYQSHANVSVLVVAFFLYVAAGREQATAAYVFLRYLTRKQWELERSRCLPAQPVVVLEKTRLKEVLDGFMPRRYHLVWVLDEAGRLKGVATEREIIDALFRSGMDTPVGAIARSLT